MKIFKKKCYISKEENQKIQELLSLDEIKDNKLQDTTIFQKGFNFKNDYFVNIKVCSGQQNFFIDSVLFDEKGQELMCLEPNFELLGEYIFDCNNNRYVIEILVR